MNARLNVNAQAVLDAVCSTTQHPTALEIYELVKQKRPGIGIASVYRILHQLVARGHLRELRFGDESSRYDANTARHDHAICHACGLLLDIPIDLMLPMQSLKEAAGMVGITLDTHEVRLYGLCASCQQALAESASGDLAQH